MKKELMDKREHRIMQRLWDQPEGSPPLSVSDLEALFAGEKISRNSIFKALQSLLGKEYIRVAGLERAGSVYARQYEPRITREEYAAILLAHSGIRTSSLGSLALAMIGNDKDDAPDEAKDEELIRELEQVIERVRGGKA